MYFFFDLIINLKKFQSYIPYDIKRPKFRIENFQVYVFIVEIENPWFSITTTSNFIFKTIFYFYGVII